MHSTKERVVVSVGGSLIVPDGIDTDFLIRFKALILDKVEKRVFFLHYRGWRQDRSSLSGGSTHSDSALTSRP